MKGYANGMDQDTMDDDDVTQTANRIRSMTNNRLKNAHRESFANLHRLRRGSRQAAPSIKNSKHNPSVEASESFLKSHQFI